jgi:hypothetical protein
MIRNIYIRVSEIQNDLNLSNEKEFLLGDVDLLGCSTEVTRKLKKNFTSLLEVVIAVWENGIDFLGKIFSENDILEISLSLEELGLLNELD